MRIISDHRDYYDCVQAQGQDLTCVWVRRFEEVEYNQIGRRWPFPLCFSDRYNRRAMVNICEYIVGFCGQIYPALHVTKSVKGCAEQNAAVCYTLDEVDSFVREHFKTKQFDSYMKPKKYDWRDKNRIGVTHKQFQEFFEECIRKQSGIQSIFVDQGCPVFIARRYTWLGNPRHPWFGMRPKIVYHGRREDPDRPDDGGKELIQLISRPPIEEDKVLLKDLEFFRIVPTDQAYQEIWQYLSGVLGLNNPQVPVPNDKTMRDIKGFDDSSFKKEPSKKRKPSR